MEKVWWKRSWFAITCAVVFSAGLVGFLSNVLSILTTLPVAFPEFFPNPKTPLQANPAGRRGAHIALASREHTAAVAPRIATVVVPQKLSHRFSGLQMSKAQSKPSHIEVMDVPKAQSQTAPMQSHVALDRPFWFDRLLLKVVPIDGRYTIKGIAILLKNNGQLPIRYAATAFRVSADGEVVYVGRQGPASFVGGNGDQAATYELSFLRLEADTRSIDVEFQVQYDTMPSTGLRTISRVMHYQIQKMEPFDAIPSVAAQAED